MTAFFAPFSLSSSTAAETPFSAPAMTVCPGQLKLTACTAPCALAAAQASMIVASSRPMIAAIAPSPTGTASCI